MSEYSSINKFSAYKVVAYDYNAAREILYQKKLAYGEAAICPFYYPNQDSSTKSVEMMEGIGALNGGMLINCNITSNDVVLDNAVVTTPDSPTPIALKEVIADIYNRLKETN